MSKDVSGLPEPSRRSRYLKRGLWIFFPAAVFLLFAMSLRAPAFVISPLLRRITTDLGMTDAQGGALTAVPIFCFGIMTPFASAWLRKVGANTGALHCFALIILGAIARSLGGVVLAFAGMIIIGVGLSIGNLVAPMIIGREFQRRAPLMSGLYSSFVNITQAFATACAVPTALLLGWRGAIALWSIVPAIIGAAAWIWVFPPGKDYVRPSIAAHIATAPVYKFSPISQAPKLKKKSAVGSFSAWLVAIAFAGHTFSYYGVVAWLPISLADILKMGEGKAGTASSVFHFIGIIGPVLVPLMYSVFKWSTAQVTGVISLCWLTLPVGLIFFPNLWLLWLFISGLAQGGFFSALIIIVIDLAADIDENRQISALMQTVGYCASTVAPVLVGQVHSHVKGWSIPFCIIAFSLLLSAACAQYLARRLKKKKDASPTPRIP